MSELRGFLALLYKDNLLDRLVGDQRVAYQIMTNLEVGQLCF